MREENASIELRPRNSDFTTSENRKINYINMQHVSNCVASTSQASQPLHEIYRYIDLVFYPSLNMETRRGMTRRRNSHLEFGLLQYRGITRRPHVHHHCNPVALERSEQERLEGGEEDSNSQGIEWWPELQQSF